MFVTAGTANCPILGGGGGNLVPVHTSFGGSWGRSFSASFTPCLTASLTPVPHPVLIQSLPHSLPDSYPCSFTFLLHTPFLTFPCLTHLPPSITSYSLPHIPLPHSLCYSLPYSLPPCLPHFIPAHSPTSLPVSLLPCLTNSPASFTPSRTFSQFTHSPASFAHSSLHCIILPWLIHSPAILCLILPVYHPISKWCEAHYTMTHWKLLRYSNSAVLAPTVIHLIVIVL